jgi:hypothetical protein
MYLLSAINMQGHLDVTEDPAVAGGIASASFKNQYL